MTSRRNYNLISLLQLSGLRLWNMWNKHPLLAHDSAFANFSRLMLKYFLTESKYFLKPTFLQSLGGTRTSINPLQVLGNNNLRKKMKTFTLQSSWERSRMVVFLSLHTLYNTKWLMAYETGKESSHYRLQVRMLLLFDVFCEKQGINYCTVQLILDI